MSGANNGALVERDPRDAEGVAHSRAVLVVPRSRAVARMLDAAALATDARARRVGICVLAPKDMLAAELALACDVWPALLRTAGVARVAIVLGVESYAGAAPVFSHCIARFAEACIAFAYFHEAHLESDEIRAWFAGRPAQRPLCDDMLVALARRYRDRCDARAARAALYLVDSTQPTRTTADTVACPSSNMS